MNDILETTLAQLGEQLNCANIFWGVGASVLLAQYNLVENPTDIDIVVSMDDIKKADLILSSLGEKKKEKGDDEVYKTSYFYEYIVNGIEVDLMAGLKIKTENELFEYKFDRQTKLKYFRIQSQTIPFMTLDDWYILYQIIPNREEKVKLIHNFLMENDLTKV